MDDQCQRLGKCINCGKEKVIYAPSLGSDKICISCKKQKPIEHSRFCWGCNRDIDINLFEGRRRLCKTCWNKKHKF